MAKNNPVQIILNHNDFMRAPEPKQFGPERDFFEGRDPAFVAHRTELIGKIDEIAAEIADAGYGPAAYLRVEMRTEALAKSYRPNRFLLTPDLFPCVGADGVGTLYFRASLIYLETLKKRIRSAEDQVAIHVSRNTGEAYKAPSRARSEVGAIDVMQIAPPSGKRNFSTADALLSLRDPHTVSGYHVELFETPDERVIADDPLGRRALRESLDATFASMGPGTQVFRVPRIGSTPLVEFVLTDSTQPAKIESRIEPGGRDTNGPTVSLVVRRAGLDFSPSRHEAALNRLAAHPLVRTIRPPVELSVDYAEPAVAGDTTPQIPTPSDQATYPIVGVIDTGVADVLSAWTVGRFDYLDKTEVNEKHGTNVAALVVAGQSLNSVSVASEADGCRIYDAALYPTGPFSNHYPNLFIDFLEELEQAVADASQNFGVRIFNLSINATSAVEQHRYSIYASRLDDIADKYGVLFVNSAGNLKASESRTPWQKRPLDVVNYFASRQSPDTIYKPSESVRAISVGALNPPGTSQIAFAPTTYTRRGPGLQVGVKPDVATFGGTGITAIGQSTGLQTISRNGKGANVAGTSFAAPLIARALAGLDSATQGGLGTDGLRAMLLHHTEMTAPLAKRGLGSLARQFAGFGQPCSVADMLETDESKITLFFESRLTANESKPAILRFSFDWPASLVNAGACSGKAKMTLVFSPPLDPAFGAEFVRVNLEASLSQRQPIDRKDGKPSFTNQIAARYLPKTKALGIPEKALIDHGLKWWPTKQYESVFDQRGASSSWRLEVTSLIRAEAKFPPEGVPFAVVLSIEDPAGAKPIFREMRQALQASTANAVDIRTAVRVRPRAR